MSLEESTNNIQTLTSELQLFVLYVTVIILIRQRSRHVDMNLTPNPPIPSTWLSAHGFLADYRAHLSRLVNNILWHFRHFNLLLS